MNQRILALCLGLALLLCACAPAQSPAPQPPDDGRLVAVTDLYGREVELPEKIERIVCLGAGALRMVAYIEAQDLLCGVEDTEKTQTIARPYSFVNHELFASLPSVGKGGGRSYTAYDEELIRLSPDLIICAYNSEALETLAQKTDIPILAVTYDDGMFDKKLINSLTLLGEVLGKQERAEELISALTDAKLDLNRRMEGILEADKPSAYAGAVTYQGGHGFEGTYAGFPPFTALGVNNIADQTGQQGAFNMDLEKVLELDPKFIFLDPANQTLIDDGYAKNPAYYQSLAAVQKGNVYTLPSFNNYTTNIELALADTYWVGKVLYPDRFSDIEIETTAGSYFTLFLGEDLYPQMRESGLAFGTMKIGEVPDGSNRADNEI